VLRPVQFQFLFFARRQGAKYGQTGFRFDVPDQEFVPGPGKERPGDLYSGEGWPRVAVAGGAWAEEGSRPDAPVGNKPARAKRLPGDGLGGYRTVGKGCLTD